MDVRIVVHNDHALGTVARMIVRERIGQGRASPTFPVQVRIGKVDVCGIGRRDGRGCQYGGVGSDGGGFLDISKRCGGDGVLAWLKGFGGIMLLFLGEFDLSVDGDASKSFVLYFAVCYELVQLGNPLWYIIGEVGKTLQGIHLRGHWWEAP